MGGFSDGHLCINCIKTLKKLTQYLALLWVKKGHFGRNGHCDKILKNIKDTAIKS